LLELGIQGSDKVVAGRLKISPKTMNHRIPAIPKLDRYLRTTTTN
jgi:hypothetical protein